MFAKKKEKELVWVGSSLDDLKGFPDDVMDFVGFALRDAQEGRKHQDVKPLNKGKLKGKGVYEIVDDYDGDTYRAVYTVEIKERVYVLHCFQKKSKKGKETPKSDIDLIRTRYNAAKDLHEQLNKEPPDISLIKRYLGKYFKKYFPKG